MQITDCGLRLVEQGNSLIDQGYKKLDVYNLSHSLAVQIHSMSMVLPQHEMYEQGGQIRRSSKSVCAQIVEGYALRVHKKEFLLYLQRAYASAQETIEHLDLLKDTQSLKDEYLYEELRKGYDGLSGKLFKLIQSVGEDHTRPYSVREELEPYNL